MRTVVSTGATFAAARQPPLGEAEAIALTASHALAASATERSAAGPLPWPLYFIATRDCFTFELAALTKQVPTTLLASAHPASSCGVAVVVVHHQLSLRGASCLCTGVSFEQALHADGLLFPSW